MAEFQRHEPCPSCGSSDGLGRYSDGSAHCFTKCGYNERGDGTAISLEDTEPKDWTPLHGDYQDLPKRGLKEETLRFWQYQVGDKCQIANFFDEHRVLVSQKLRLPGKKFKMLGDGKNAPLYGRWLWSGGKQMTITEGELDALSMSQAFDNKWPVTSLPNGVDSAKKCIEKNYEYLDGFERIVLMFDMDKPGRAAIEEVAPMLPPGKVAIAELPEKDANEVLLKHGPGKLVDAFWKAKLWRPDGIIDGSELTVERLMAATSKGFDLPYPDLNDMLLGLRKRELTLLTAGSGIGKSSLARELAYYLHQEHGCSIGNVYLEESNVKTGQGYVALYHNVPLGSLRHDTALLSVDQWTEAAKNVVHQRMKFYDHFGSLESKRLITKLRYMAAVDKVDFIILDHISIVTSGLEASTSEGERRDIDILMTRLRSLIEETGVGIIAIVHLKRVTGKNFNEGAQISLNDLRGSASLEQLSDNVIGLERNQQVAG